MEKNISTDYIEKQYFYILIFPLLLLIFVIIFLYIYDIGSKPIPTLFSVPILAIFLFLILLFYKMEIIICKDYVKIKFGIGFIQKVIKKEDIIKIDEMSIPWYYGMGIRIINNGYLYNTKPGVGIVLVTKKKKYVVVSSFHSKLIKILNKNQTHLQ